MEIAGLLLTGGASGRMGRDKATLPVAGETLAARVARALSAVAAPVLAVGHAAGTELPVVADAREGPLVAVAAGAAELRARGVAESAAVLVVACDLPFVTPGVLRGIAGVLGEADAEAAVPRVGGRDQPLCAAYLLGPLWAHAEALVAGGERSMRALVARLRVVPVAAEPDPLADVDTPEDWRKAQTRL